MLPEVGWEKRKGPPLGNKVYARAWKARVKRDLYPAAVLGCRAPLWIE
jgi:hypothetical protein